MRKLLVSLALLAFACVLPIMPAQAQTRVFVAAHGSDANPCTFALPCRSFQHAHDTVAAGGEIDVLDPAGYGALTITKSISIQGHGFAGIAVPPSGTGIIVNAGASGIVKLNGLIIDGNGSGRDGIAHSVAGFVGINDCIIGNLTDRGLDLAPNATTSYAISNTIISNTGLQSIVVGPQEGNFAVNLTLSRSELHSGGTRVGVGGLQVDAEAISSSGTINIVVSDSISANQVQAFEVLATQAHVTLTLLRSIAAASGTGILAQGPTGVVRLAQSTISGNQTGYSLASGAVLTSYGDNYIADNGGNTGTLGTISKQ